MTEEDADQPLPLLFSRAQEVTARLEEGDAVSAAPDATRQALELLQLCDDAVERLSLFASNEEKDDLVTSNLKYLSVPYHEGKLLATSPTRDLAARAAALERSNACYMRFLQCLRQYGLLDVHCYTTLERLEAGEATDPTTTRTQKIAMFKRERELNRQLAELKQQRIAAVRLTARYDSDSSTDDPAGNSHDGKAGYHVGKASHDTCDGAESAVDEEQEREAWFLQLDLYALKAVSQLAVAAAELEVLAHAQSLPPKQQQIDASESAADKAPPPPPLLAQLLRDAAAKGPGARLDPAAVRRDLLRPMHRQPTRTLAQQADIEMAQARDATERQAAAEAAHATAGSDDEDDVHVRRRVHARDDWKDDHPFGYGNSKLRPTA